MANYSDCVQDLVWANGMSHIWDNGAYLEFYTGPLPASANLSPSDENKCLLRMMLPNNPFKAASPDLVLVNTTWESIVGDALDYDTPTWARLRKIEDFNTTEIPNRFPRMDVTVGTALPSELILDVGTIDYTTVIRISSFSFNRSLPLVVV